MQPGKTKAEQEAEARRQQFIDAVLERLKTRTARCYHHRWNPTAQKALKSFCPCGEYMGGW